ncbi:nucleoplasmin-2 isoform X15 [Callithrix jacchus]
MNLSSTSSTEEKAVTTVLWGCELSQERRTWTFRPQPKGKQDCKLLLHTICLGEKAKEEMHRVEILPPGNREDKKTQPVTIASLQASVLPMVRLSMLVGKLPPAPASPSPFGGNGHTRGSPWLEYSFLPQLLSNSGLAQDLCSSVAMSVMKKKLEKEQEEVRTFLGQVWWYTPAVPAIREAEAGGSREPGRSRLQ